jgi:hypothetical protein
MAFDGNGIFQLPSPAYPLIPNTTASAEDMNAILAEIAAALSSTMPKDGTGGPTANINWQNFKILSLANGTSDGDAVNYGQVFKNPSFVAPKAQASPAFGDNSLLLATTEWVRNLTLNSALPGQVPAKAGFFLRTDGANADFVSIDSRGHSHADKGNSGVVAQVCDYSVTETWQITVTGNTTISFTGFPAGRMCVGLLKLKNGGAFTTAFTGITWIKSDGAETSQFSDLGITLQANGTDRIIICAEPGATPWAKVVR